MAAFQKLQEQSQAKTENLQIARKVNQLTYKVRVQNGGNLVSERYMSNKKYPKEREVQRMMNLDLQPNVQDQNERKVLFDNFRINHQFRPSTSNPQSKPRGNNSSQASITQMQRKQSMQGSAFQRKGSTQKETAFSSPKPKIGIVDKQSLLLQQLKEIRSKFAEEQSISEEENNDTIKKSIQIDQSVNTNFLQKVQKRVSKKFSVEEKLMIQLEREKNDRYMRVPAISNKMRVIQVDSKYGIPQDFNKLGLTRANKVNEQFFDPLRLKILVMPFKDANPIGKNADYFFLKGFKQAVSEELPQAMHSYMKGLEIKQDHLLCRFNLGVVLFRLGLFEEAFQQYETLLKQGYDKRTAVIYNKIICCLQIGKYNDALESCSQCIDIIMDRPPENRDQEMLKDLHTILGICLFKMRSMKKAGQLFDFSKKFTVERVSELQILLKKSIRKQIQEKMMEYLRLNTNTIETSILVANNIDKEKTDTLKLRQKTSRKIRAKTRNDILSFKAQRRFYMTAILDDAYLLDLNPDLQEGVTKKRYNSARQLQIEPIFDLKEESSLQLRKPYQQQNQIQTLEHLLNKAEAFIKNRKDPDQMYFYINDNKNLRLEKLLDIPNFLENEDQKTLTEEEKVEKAKRESITYTLLPSDIKKEVPEEKIDEKEYRLNYYLDHYFQIGEKDLLKGPEQKIREEQSYLKLVSQMRKFNEVLNKSQLDIGKTQKIDNLQVDKKAKLYNQQEAELTNLKERVFKQEAQKKKKKDKIRKTLPVEEVSKLLDGFSQPASKRNYKMINKIASKLKCFQVLSDEMRAYIFKHSNLKEYSQNEIVYQQGSIGDLYYFILRGSVTMVSKRQDFGNFEIFLKTYYDGEVIGEQPLILPNQQDNSVSGEQAKKLLIRDDTCVCNETCVLLEVSNQVKVQLYTSDENCKGFQRNLNWLRKQSIFLYIETFYLIQMVFSLEKRVFKFGEYIQKSGTVPDGMIIVTKGQCLCVFETIGLKKLEEGQQYSRYQSQPKDFSCGVALPSSDFKNSKAQSPKEHSKPKRESLSVFEPQFSVFNQLKNNPQKSFQSTRIYLDEEGKHMKNFTAFQDNVIFNRLVPGDSFGHRTLLPQEELLKRIKLDSEDFKKGQIMSLFKRTSTIKKFFNNFHKKEAPLFNQANLNIFRSIVYDQKTNALSVIADSNEVEVLVLKPSAINYLPECLKENLYNDIAKAFDPANPSSLTEIMKQKDDIQNWEKSKQCLVMKIRKSQFMERQRNILKR